MSVFRKQSLDKLALTAFDDSEDLRCGLGE